jgi:hypothetical protein
MQNKYTISLLVVLIILTITLISFFIYFINNNLVHAPISESNVKVSADVPKEISHPIPVIEATNEELFFSEKTPKSTNVSNVVGYFAGGAFLTYIPQWMADNWSIDSTSDGATTTITPNKPTSNKKDFSDIVINVAPTDETFNAEWLFESNKKDSIVSEVIINEAADM